MDFSGKVKDIGVNGKEFNITLSTYNSTIIDDLQKLKDNNREISINIKRKSHKRTQDSNSYLWHLCEEIAKVINSDKDLVYIDMLGKYGVFTHVVVKSNVVPRMKEQWKLVKELGEVSINGNSGIQLQCYFGSSCYTQEEMSRLLKGIVNECKDLNIPTLEDKDLNSMIKEWGI